MMKSIFDDVRREFEIGNHITRLILINVAVFVVMSLLKVFTNFSGAGGDSWFNVIWKYVTLSNDWIFNLTHPWVFVTHMFLHIGFWHILWNMLFLYWFGRRVGDLIGDRHIVPLYFYGGLTCAIAFMLSASVLGYIPDGQWVMAHGASGAAMAFVVAAAVLSPDSYMHLILIGPVKLKYISFALVFLDIIALGSDYNTGGHFGHLGGAAMGWFYIYALRNGWNLAPTFTITRDEKKTNIRVMSDYPTPSKRQHAPTKSFKKYFTKTDEGSDAIIRNIDEEVDRILDKIREKGMDSLTDKEKETLQNASKDE